VDALEKAEQLQPDLVVLDLSMPRMDGLEAARELKKRMPQVPLILFTMHAAVTSGNSAAAAGFDAIISNRFPPCSSSLAGPMCFQQGRRTGERHG
jgi:CheY-like chemotaxis protein